MLYLGEIVVYDAIGKPSVGTVTWNSFNGAYDGSNIFPANMAPNVYTEYSITQLVKGWKNGKYQAAAGFMLANFNESDVSKKKGPFSSEYSNAEYRPYVVMTYTEPQEEMSISLNVSSLTLSLNDTEILSATTNPSGSVVTWTTSNPYVAHVSPSGIVCAQGIGTATITASVTLGSTTLTATCYVNVKLADGVYYFECVGAQRRLGLFSENSYTENAFVGAWSFNPSANISRYSLFKVKNISGNVYSIRSMLDNKMGWIRYGNSLRCATIGTSNTNLDTIARWLIDTDEIGTYIYSYVGSSTSLKNYTITYNSLVDDTHFTELQPFSSTNTLQRWRITPYTDSVHGIVIKSKVNYLAVGGKHTFTAGVYSSNANITGQHGFTWTVTNGTGQAVIDAATGVLTAVSPGTVTVSVKYNSYVWSATHDVNIILADGIYLLRNRQNGLYADIKDQIMSNGTLIHQWESHKGDTQRWVFTHQSNGYFTIKSLYSDQTDYYLSVNNNSTALNTAIVLRSGTITNGMLWKIEPTSNGAFKLIPKTGEANGYVLATTLSSATNGATLIQGEYVTNTSYKDEWYVKRQAWSIGGGFAVGGGTIKPKEKGTSVDVTEYTEWWKACGYEAFYHVEPTAAQLNKNSLTSSIVCFSSHGSQHYIILPNDVHLSSEIGVAIIESEYEDAEKELQGEPILISDYDLSGTSLYIYNACLTAANNENLCTATIDAGAECVIGWAVKVDQFGSYAWLDVLQARLRQGATVGEAVDYANSFLYDRGYDTVKENRVYGNRDLVINPTARLSEDFVSFPAEEGLYTTPIPYHEHTEAQFKAILEERFDNYRDYKCKIEQSFLDDTKNNYVIDLHYYRAGDEDDYEGNAKFISSCVGYTAIVKNNVIVAIREQNMDPSDWPFLLRETPAPEITQTIIDRTYEQLIAEMEQFDFEYTITEQTGQGVYDARADTYYYELSAVYELVSGAVGVYSTRYRIPKGEIQ